VARVANLNNATGSSPINDSAVRVVAGAILRADGCVLIAQRPPGKWQAGRWEFPGGKIEPREEALAALERELREELAIEVTKAQPLGDFTYRYPDRSVAISLWLVSIYVGEPRGMDGQALRWVPLAQLDDCDLLEADQPMIAPLCSAAREALRP
jgi:8-oxo-dGTP diphosphatase